VHERRPELAQAAAVVVRLREEGPLHARLERLLERRDEDHRHERQRHGGAGDDERLRGAERARERRDAETPGHEDDGYRQREAHELADDVVDVHQPVADDRVGDDAREEHAAHVAERIGVEAVDGQEVREGERDLDETGQEPELRLRSLARRRGLPIRLPCALGPQRQEDHEERREAAVERPRHDVPAPRLLRKGLDERALEVHDRKDRGRRVGAGEEAAPRGPRRLAQYEREVERRHRREADAHPEHPAPELRQHRVVEVVEAEDVDVPGDDARRHEGERPVEGLAEPLAEHQQGDDEVRQRRAERDQGVIRHWTIRLSGRPRGLSSEPPAL